MKTALRKALPLLLCLILCLGLTPAALAAEADEILITEDYEPYLPADDSVTFIFELSDAEVFDAAGDIVTISFDANGGAGTMGSQDFVRGDAAKPLNPNTFTRDGYYFLGWNERADGTAGGGRIINNGAAMRLSEASSSSALTLYAQWKEIGPEGLTVTVSFDPNGGTGTMAAQDYVRGEVIKPLNSNTFTRDGYIFTHWNTAADGSGTEYQNGARIAPSENMTLYAQWTDTVLVHYDPNGASGTRKAQKFTLGVTGKLVAMERIGYVMDGYEFVGWAPVSDAAPNDPRIIPDGGEFTAEGETTLYAIWKKVPGIAIDKAHFPDDAFRSYVSANLDQNGDGELSKSDIAAVTQINVSGSYNEPGAIQSLEGIQYFTELKELSCGFNALSSLDVSRNTALTSLNCYNNQLMNLDVSSNTALTYLSCSDNQLASLDVSNNTALTSLFCGNNQLTSLDVSENIRLRDLGCWGNQITSLDVSNNSALTRLLCENNQLTRLDVSQNNRLYELDCGSNQLTSLDIRQNIALKYILCNGNQLTRLDVSNNSALTFLDCENNQLTSLDLNHNSVLACLRCNSNQLKELNITACPCLLTIIEVFTPDINNGVVGYFYACPISIPDSGRNPFFKFDESITLITSPSSGLILPDSLAEIGEEAFADGVFSYVILPEGTVSIGPRAFANCRELAAVYIPENVTEIVEDAFENVDGLTIIGESQSTAIAFAMAHRYSFIMG